MATWTFVVVFAKEQLNLSGEAIGFITAMNALAALISNYTFGRRSDMYGRSLLIYLGLATSTIAFLLHLFMYDFVTMALTRILLGFTSGIFTASLIALIADARKKMGKFSSFGSLGWGFGSLAGGAVATFYTLQGTFLLSSIMYVVAFIMAIGLKDSKSFKPIAIPLFPRDIIRRNLIVYLPFLVRHTGAFMIWTLWPLFLLALGADLFFIGIIQATNMTTQFFVMLTLTDRIKGHVSLQMGLVISTLTFLGFAFAPSYMWILLLQVPLGFSWAFMYVGALRILTETNPEKATVTGLFQSLISLCALIGPLLTALVLSLMDEMLYKEIVVCILIAAGMSFASIVIYRVLAMRKWHSNPEKVH